MKTNFDKFKTPITIEDCYRWMEDHGEEIMVDGPFSFRDTTEQIFFDLLNAKPKLLKHLIDDDGNPLQKVTSKWDVAGSGDADDKPYEKILLVFVQFLNQIGVRVDDDGEFNPTHV